MSLETLLLQSPQRSLSGSIPRCVLVQEQHALALTLLSCPSHSLALPSQQPVQAVRLSLSHHLQ